MFFLVVGLEIKRKSADRNAAEMSAAFTVDHRRVGWLGLFGAGDWGPAVEGDSGDKFSTDQVENRRLLQAGEQRLPWLR
jgi:hypothetical protein